MKSDSNPWEVSNLECFLFYCCPECDYKCQDVTGFESHAQDNHPMSTNAIIRMKEVIGMYTKYYPAMCPIQQGVL